MPRPKKWRKVCGLPSTDSFGPLGADDCLNNAVFMAVDEYETIRLIDHQGFTQEECCQYMGVSRTTIQQIYNDARKKIALSLVECRVLKIGGGEYRVCDGDEKVCACGGCNRHRCLTNINSEKVKD